MLFVSFQKASGRCMQINIRWFNIVFIKSFPISKVLLRVVLQVKAKRPSQKRLSVAKNTNGFTSAFLNLWMFQWEPLDSQRKAQSFTKYQPQPGGRIKIILQSKSNNQKSCPKGNNINI